MHELNADLVHQITQHEGIRLKPYRCTAGKLTIGIGRNLDDNGITADEADYLLFNDLRRCVDELRAAFPWYEGLSERRKHALIDMCFNLGIEKLKRFSSTLWALQEGRWEDARQFALQSKWATQVGKRAETVTGMFL